MNNNDMDPVDMGRGVTVLRCVADFIGARPILPAMTALEVDWSHVDRLWTVKIHLFRASTRDMDRWASALDDAVTTHSDRSDVYLGDHTHIEVAGTVHGHPVRAWTLLDRSGR
ncbi:hypothetical protein [Streptomyces sp. SID3343]|uniref:hypothetical protein n=1 Tax=Streptomyces sp. SID3343 TaxID=2690260 RepID=UPI00136E2054|nr:hypothetical protein [Streptomyces sp. SID3343]MYW04514.1 hypothetical protein [Streptomyces sp. SID3343]